MLSFQLPQLPLLFFSLGLALPRDPPLFFFVYFSPLFFLFFLSFFAFVPLIIPQPLITPAIRYRLPLAPSPPARGHKDLGDIHIAEFEGTSSTDSKYALKLQTISHLGRLLAE